MEASKKKTDKTKINIKDLIPAFVLSFAASFLLFIYAPMDLYCSNKREFWFDAFKLIPVILVLFTIMLVGSIFVFFLIYIISKKAYKVAVALYFIAYFATYIQGNFLVSNLPALDGTEVDWSSYVGQRLATIILWVVVIAIVICMIKLKGYKFFEKASQIVGLFITGMLFLTLITIVIMNNGFEKKLNLYASIKNEYLYSEDKNYVILVLDALDAGSFNDVLEEHPEYREVLADFTYYRNTMGAYPYTMNSLPFILSGDWYENDEPFDEYNVNAYKNSPIMSGLENEGYILGMYEEELPVSDESMYKFDNTCNSSKISSKEFFLFSVREIQLIGYRYAPFDLKRFCGATGTDFNLFRGDGDEYPIFRANNTSYYNRLQESEISLIEDKCFKFIHIEGAHVPFVYDKDVNVIENGTYEDNIQASMTITEAYLNKLKESGVYDNSVIIVMADHGYAHMSAVGRQDPILFIKGIDEAHDSMLVSDAPISYDDLQEAYIGLLNGKMGTDVFFYKEGDERQRRFLYYDSESKNITEYISNGYSSDDAALVPSGVVFEAE